jgi:hypothetical protein
MKPSSEDVARARELMDEGVKAGRPVAEIARRLAAELPHLTEKDFAQIAGVDAEELRMEAAELNAAADGAKQMAEILAETGAPNLGVALPLLCERSAAGDRRAAELLRKFERTVSLLDMGPRS